MAICTTCNLCDHPGSLAGAKDVGKVPCNVRRFKEDVFTLWRCTGCGSQHCAEDADLPLYYAHYPLKDQKLTFHERIGHGNRLRLLERLGFGRQGRVLDYGCGTGMEPLHVHRRFYYDSLIPTVNARFIWRYIQKCEGLLDAAVEPPRIGLVWKSPDLLFLAFFGYFLPRGDNMIVTFRKTK